MSRKYMKFFSAIILVVSTVLSFSACAQRRPVIKPQKVVLRDAQGTERAILLIRDGEAELSLFTATGKTIFDFSFSEAGLNLEVVDESGERHGGTITSEPLEEHR